MSVTSALLIGEEPGVRLVNRGCDRFLNLDPAPSFTTQAESWATNFQNDPARS